MTRCARPNGGWSPVLVCALAVMLAACGPGSDDPDGGGGGGDGAVNLDGAQGTDDGGPRTDAGIQGCNPQNFTLQQAPPPEIYLVVDRSGSMLAPGSQPLLTKWDELNNAVDFVVTQFDASIYFGLLMYPGGGECSTTGPQVGVGADNSGAVAFQLNNTTPAGGTPTAAALTNAAISLADVGSADSPDFIILATDGGPNCNYFLDAPCSCAYAASEYCCTQYPGQCVFGNSCLDDSGTLDTITDLHDNMNIDTFVIGLAGTAEYTDLLDAMAVAGGRPQGGVTEYYDASSQAELQTALEDIAASVISCVIQLDEPPVEPDLVRIYIDGVEVPRDGTMMNGWDYTDSSNDEIELFGAACGTLQDGDPHTMTATFGCIVP